MKHNPLSSRTTTFSTAEYSSAIERTLNVTVQLNQKDYSTFFIADVWQDGQSTVDFNGGQFKPEWKTQLDSTKATAWVARESQVFPSQVLFGFPMKQINVAPAGTRITKAYISTANHDNKIIGIGFEYSTDTSLKYYSAEQLIDTFDGVNYWSLQDIIPRLQVQRQGNNIWTHHISTNDFVNIKAIDLTTSLGSIAGIRYYYHLPPNVFPSMMDIFAIEFLYGWDPYLGPRYYSKWTKKEYTDPDFPSFILSFKDLEAEQYIYSYSYLQTDPGVCLLGLSMIKNVNGEVAFFPHFGYDFEPNEFSNYYGPFPQSRSIAQAWGQEGINTVTIPLMNWILSFDLTDPKYRGRNTIVIEGFVVPISLIKAWQQGVNYIIDTTEPYREYLKAHEGEVISFKKEGYSIVPHNLQGNAYAQNKQLRANTNQSQEIVITKKHNQLMSSSADSACTFMIIVFMVLIFAIGLHMYYEHKRKKEKAMGQGMMDTPSPSSYSQPVNRSSSMVNTQ